MRDETIFAGGIPAKYLAICPLDGRYAEIGEVLAPYFSEYALVKERVKVEVYWLQFLIENVEDSDILMDFNMNMKEMVKILAIYNEFSAASFKRVKEIEAVTNHDVKAVELFIAEKLEEAGLEELKSYVHIGCTSEDITNCAYASILKRALNEVWIPAAKRLIEEVVDMALNYQEIAMLAHTHGQPATPTTVGKEFMVYAYRMRESLDNIESIKCRAKFNGATGNYAAISVAFPKVNWPELSRKFVETCLELDFNPVTTQIESHDYMCHLLDGICHFNNVVLDLDLDMWLYISMEYFKQIAVKSEVGSSTMPHKVNPIRFENSEANIDMSNAICMALSNKLPRSRMQRDLSDSSSQRNFGLSFGYSLQAINQTIGGLKKVAVNKEKIAEDLNDHWTVLAEPIQTVLRKYGIPDAYDKLKELTRGKQISAEDIKQFISTLDGISENDKFLLSMLTPDNYVGFAKKIVEDEYLS